MIGSFIFEFLSSDFVDRRNIGTGRNVPSALSRVFGLGGNWQSLSSMVQLQSLSSIISLAVIRYRIKEAFALTSELFQ